MTIKLTDLKKLENDIFEEEFLKIPTIIRKKLSLEFQTYKIRRSLASFEEISKCCYTMLEMLMNRIDVLAQNEGYAVKEKHCCEGFSINFCKPLPKAFN